MKNRMNAIRSLLILGIIKTIFPTSSYKYVDVTSKCREYRGTPWPLAVKKILDLILVYTYLGMIGFCCWYSILDFFPFSCVYCNILVLGLTVYLVGPPGFYVNWICLSFMLQHSGSRIDCTVYLVGPPGFYVKWICLSFMFIATFWYGRKTNIATYWQNKLFVVLRY